MIEVCKDEELIGEFLSGNEEAFEKIIDQYKAYVFAIILKFIKNQSDAQDVAQEVFLQIYRSLPKYRADNFKAWVGKITTHKAIDWKRANAKILLDDVEKDLSVLKDDRDWSNPDMILLQEEHREKVREMCQKIPEKYRNIINQFYFQSKTYNDIAREEGISLKTVESRLYRARGLFREKWKEELRE